MESKYLLTFSICKEALIQRWEILKHLNEHGLNLKIAAIFLEDHTFTLTIESEYRSENRIMEILRSKGFEIKLQSAKVAT